MKKKKQVVRVRQQVLDAAGRPQQPEQQPEQRHLRLCSFLSQILQVIENSEMEKGPDYFHE